MALSVNTNVDSLNAYRNLTVTQGDLSKSLEKLSSGFRINRAADDAAGLAISEGLRSQVNGLKQASRNAQDGISVVQTAEGALTETHSILQRMRTLTVQASNSGGLNADAKGNIQTEISELKSELNRISETTQYNGTKLLDGSFTAKNFQVGANKGETIGVAISTDMDATGLGIAGLDVTSAGTLATSLYTAPTAAGAAGGITFAIGSFDALADFDNLSGNITIGSKTLDLSSVKFAATDDTTDEKRTALGAAISAAFGSDATVTAGNSTQVFTVVGTSTGPTGETTQAAAARAVVFTAGTGAADGLDKIDKAIKTVSTVRAELGAKQNRLDHTIKNLAVATENLTASESRIRDTDMAAEMSSFTRSQILSQAGTSMLAQANQIPQGVLSLLR